MLPVASNVSGSFCTANPTSDTLAAMTWTRDQVIGLAAIGVGGVGIAVTIGVALWQKTKKVLGFETWPPAKLVSIEPKLRGRFKVTFDGKEVEGPHWGVIRVVNAGGAPIVRGDYETPVTIELPCTIIQAHTYEEKPADLAPAITATGKTIQLEPMLLNPGDSFKIGLVTDGAPASPVWKGRVVGGQVRELASGSTWLSKTLSAVMNLSAASSSFLVLWLLAQRHQEKDGSAAEIWIVGAVSVPMWIGLILLANRRVWPDRWR